jgi:uncharacterized cupin superfamily protein
MVRLCHPVHETSVSCPYEDTSEIGPIRDVYIRHLAPNEKSIPHFHRLKTELVACLTGAVQFSLSRDQGRGVESGLLSATDGFLVLLPGTVHDFLNVSRHRTTLLLMSDRTYSPSSPDKYSSMGVPRTKPRCPT